MSVKEVFSPGKQLPLRFNWQFSTMIPVCNASHKILSAVSLSELLSCNQIWINLLIFAFPCKTWRGQATVLTRRHEAIDSTDLPNPHSNYSTITCSCRVCGEQTCWIDVEKCSSWQEGCVTRDYTLHKNMLDEVRVCYDTTMPLTRLKKLSHLSLYYYVNKQSFFYFWSFYRRYE